MNKKKRELIEILLDNITPDDWPKDAKWAAQDKETLTWGKNKLMFYKQDEPPFAGIGSTRFSGNMNGDIVIQLPELCKNWSKSTVTRDEFVKRWNERIHSNQAALLREQMPLCSEEIPCRFVDDKESQIDKAAKSLSKAIGKLNGVLPTAQQAVDGFKKLDGYLTGVKGEWQKDWNDQDDGLSGSLADSVSPLSTQIGGDHYAKLAIQPMQYSMENGLDALQHTVIKYVTRFRDKNGIEDLEKAKHCIDMLIEFEKESK